MSVFWELAGFQKEWLEKQDHRSKLFPNMALKGTSFEKTLILVKTEGMRRRG